MNGTPQTGKVLSVNLNAIGLSSGLTMITIQPEKAPRDSFVIFYGKDLLPFTAIALEAMWRDKAVRFTSEPTDNLPKITNIELVDHSAA